MSRKPNSSDMSQGGLVFDYGHQGWVTVSLN
jgi:hypothetical protein